MSKGAMNDRLHCGKSEPFLVPTAVKSIAELDLKHAILPPTAAAMLPPGKSKWQSASEDVN
jgi:hypothetical protein